MLMTGVRDTERDSTLQRIRREFLEMPGLQLTVGQARRLWALDDATCLQLLGALVEARFLRRTEQGSYMRLTAGRIDHPLPATGRTSGSGQR
jgi:hypothetical protein